MIYYGVSHLLSDDFNINAYLFVSNKMIFTWSENKLLILEKRHYTNAFWIFFVEGQSKVSHCFPASELKYSVSLSGGFPKHLTPRKRLFLIDQITVNSQQTYLFSQFELFSQIKKVFRRAYDIVACYKNSTSGMKPVFRLFCVPVIVSQNEARGS